MENVLNNKSFIQNKLAPLITIQYLKDYRYFARMIQWENRRRHRKVGQ